MIPDILLNILGRKLNKKPEIRAATYDKKAKSLYIYFEGSKKSGIIRTEDNFLPGCNCDFNEDYQIYGLEILNVDLEDI